MPSVSVIKPSPVYQAPVSAERIEKPADAPEHQPITGDPILAELGLEDLGRLVDAIQDRFQKLHEPSPPSTVIASRDRSVSAASRAFDTEPRAAVAGYEDPSAGGIAERLTAMAFEQRTLIDNLASAPAGNDLPEDASRTAVETTREALPADRALSPSPESSAAGPAAMAAQFAEILAAAKTAATEGDCASPERPSALRTVASVDSAACIVGVAVPPPLRVPRAATPPVVSHREQPRELPGFVAGLALSLVAGVALYALL